MRGRADMLQTLRKRQFGMLFTIAAGLMVSLTVAPARAADLDLPTDAKILSGLRGVLRLLRDRDAAEFRLPAWKRSRGALRYCR